MEVKNIISEIKEKLDKKDGLKHVYFVACGGSKAAIFPGLYLLQSEAKTFGATTYTSNEFVHATPKELDERCIAVICSLKATPETVRAVEVANESGAITIAMTGSMETGMAKVGQYVVTYSNGDDQVYSDSNQANSLRIGFELLHQIEGWEKYDKAMEAYSHIDAIIAEGTESGGHVGEMTTMALVPQVIDAVSVPVVAAGGIADGRQAAAAFALGACGIQVGTCLLASEECPIHPNYKQAVLKAKDSDTVVTGRSIGGPVRILKNKMAREYLALEKRGASLEELEKVTLGGLRRAVLEGDVEMGSVMSGQVAGMLHEIRPVAEIFRDLYESGIARAKATAAEWSDAE